MSVHDGAVRWLLTPRSTRELWGWIAIVMGAGAVQLPALGRMAMQGVDIVEFEFMRTSGEAARQLVALGEPGIAAARQLLVLDYGYLVLYAIVLTALCAALARRAGAASRLAGWAPAAAVLVVIAAGCDAVENGALVMVLAGHVDQPWPGIASGFATVKFALLGLVALYLLIGWISTLRTPTRQSVP